MIEIEAEDGVVFINGDPSHKLKRCVLEIIYELYGVILK